MTVLVLKLTKIEQRDNTNSSILTTLLRPCNMARNGRSGSSKVMDFGIN